MENYKWKEGFKSQSFCRKVRAFNWNFLRDGGGGGSNHKAKFTGGVWIVFGGTQIHCAYKCLCELREPTTQKTKKINLPSYIMCIFHFVATIFIKYICHWVVGVRSVTEKSLETWIYQY